MLLKIFYNNEYHFYDSKDSDYFSFGSSYDLENDALDFFLLEKKWYFKNNTNLTISYGLKKVKPLKIKRLKENKTLKIKNLKIEMIHETRLSKGFLTIEAGHANSSIDLTKQTEYFIGRNKLCDIIIDNPMVDLKNTRIIYNDDSCYVEDLKSACGTIINGKKVRSHILKDYDIIELPGAFFTFFDKKLIYSTSNKGIRIDVSNLSKKVRDSKTSAPISLLEDINFTIHDGEFMAIVGGSGAGKSTLLDAINGRRPQTGGKVYYDLNNYYDFQTCYQKIIGYVPQRDIMHDELTVLKSLYYYCQIRMQHHLTKKEINEVCINALKDVSLYDKRNLKISKLSGGQKKRVSIAMELLSNPRVIFLDEPTSGLSPDLDLEIMTLLKNLSKNHGKTIVVITHNMENVDLCDKLIFLGQGGKLCYYGNPLNVFNFFGVKKYGEIFSLLKEPKNVEIFKEKIKLDKDYKETLIEQEKLFKEGTQYAYDKKNISKL